MGLFEEKQRLYLNYCRELNSYRDNPERKMNKKDALEAFDYYINTDKAKWINIFDDDDLVGFLIIGKGDTEKDPDSDYSIAQAYISPPYRRKGLMSRTVTKYVYDHPGQISFYVLTNNVYAARFWPWLLEEIGYRIYTVTENGDEKILCYVYERATDEE